MATDDLLALRAAELYYDADKTQEEIGALLHLTRWKVGRLLAQAKTDGLISIEIVHPRARRLPLERRLVETFGLTDAIVVSAAGSSGPEEMHSRTVHAAADYLASLRPAPALLGVSWGRTLHDISLKLKSGWSTGVDVVQINGSMSLSNRIGTAVTTAVTIAQKAQGGATLLPSPAILERLETKRAIEADRVIAGVLERARNCDAYLYSAGPADPSSVHVESGYLSEGELATLVERGAVGDVVGRYIDASGAVVDDSLDQRTVGLTLDELRGAAIGIAVISGRTKRDVARAVVTSGLCTVIVTDEDTARYILSDTQDAAEHAVESPAHEPFNAEQSGLR